MVTQVKEEYMVAGIRNQIDSLVKLHQELEAERLGKEALGWRLRAVEIQLRRLREAA